MIQTLKVMLDVFQIFIVYRFTNHFKEMMVVKIIQESFIVAHTTQMAVHMMIQKIIENQHLNKF